MSPASYRTAPPRVGSRYFSASTGRVQTVRGDLRPSGQYLAAGGFPRLLSTHWGTAKPDAFVAGADEASGAVTEEAPS